MDLWERGSPHSRWPGPPPRVAWQHVQGLQPCCCLGWELGGRYGEGQGTETGPRSPKKENRRPPVSAWGGGPPKPGPAEASGQRA